MNILGRKFRRRSLSPVEQHLENPTPSAQTFLVSDVIPATEPLETTACHAAVSRFLQGTIESCSCYHGQLLDDTRSHPLIETLHTAFATHRPVELSPDIIWLTLTQGLARHVNKNAEQLRHHFVQHEEKEVLNVRRDDFVRGSPENPWPEVFSEFSSQIRDHIGAAHELIVADFSTTGPVERAASEVVLMDAMQAFFWCRVCTYCGIPSISLRGTVDDWEAIRRRVQEWSRFDLKWWVEALLPVLNQFVAAANGHVERRFWDSIYKYHGPHGSGSPYITGWVSALFPYLYDYNNQSTKNPYLYTNDTSGGPDHGDFPALPAKAPFIWQHLGEEFEMEFIGGLIGVQQDERTLCLRPEIGWVVRTAQQAVQPDTDPRRFFGHSRRYTK